MYNSNYYLNQMKYYDNLIKMAEDEQEQYKSLKSNLSNLKSKLPSVQSDLKHAENNFLNGGYVDNNETFDKGKIKECFTNLDTINNDISSVMDKIIKKLIELENNINNYRVQYNNASSNYNSAILREQEG